ncbi:MAG TPA: glycoside hydrolase [Micrococcales bacterium]|nr:glycoside hydrolase [Micrococcales bacterium]
MPFGASPFRRDLGATSDERVSDGDAAGEPWNAPAKNQAAPLLVSTRGRVVWSERPFAFEVTGTHLVVIGSDLTAFRAGETLREAFLAASRRFFAPSGVHPALELFTAPQVNTWIEQPYTPTQESVLAYARGVLDSGMQPGVLIIDDCWSPDYGTWEFDLGRFPDPVGMVRTLHDQGFRVMLWLVPWVSPDSAVFRRLESDGLLLRDRDGETVVRRWWNGFSALLDISNPAAVAWLTERLDRLVHDVGIDGFKLDGGDVGDFRTDDRTTGGLVPAQMCEAWAAVGLRFPLNEYRACWRMGGQPLGQRLHDKPPSWGPDGIGSLVPEMLAQGMIGHPFVCPDMIGGGEIGAVSGQAGVDQEFFVRYAQVAALSPMMQFSIAPARVLDGEHRSAVDEALRVRAEMMPVIVSLVTSAAHTGEPVIRPMAYHAPELTDVHDQFFLGPDVVVAPVLERGATVRTVVLPEGRWTDPDGATVVGPAVVHVPCTLATIPRFVRAGGAGTRDTA